MHSSSVSGSQRCVSTSSPQHYSQGPVVKSGIDGMYKSRFQAGDSSDDNTYCSLPETRMISRNTHSLYRGGYLSLLYHRISALFRRRNSHRRKKYYSDHHHRYVSNYYFSPSSDNYANDSNCYSSQDSPINHQGNRKCSVTVNVESCSEESRCNSDIEYLAADGLFSNTEKSERLNIEDIRYSDDNSALDEDNYNMHVSDTSDTLSSALGSKLAHVFQGRHKSNAASYMPVDSEDPDEDIPSSKTYENSSEQKISESQQSSLDDRCLSHTSGNKTINKSKFDTSVNMIKKTGIEETRKPVDKFYSHPSTGPSHDHRARTRSFTGDAKIRSRFAEKKRRALQLACVRFSLDSCNSPPNSCLRLDHDREYPLSPLCGETITAESDMPSTSKISNNSSTSSAKETHATFRDKYQFYHSKGNAYALKGCSSVPLVDGCTCPSNNSNSATPLQTFSNPDVSFTSTGNGHETILRNRDFSRLRGGALLTNCGHEMTCSVATMPPLVSTPARGLIFGRSHDSDPGSSVFDGGCRKEYDQIDRPATGITSSSRQSLPIDRFANNNNNPSQRDNISETEFLRKQQCTSCNTIRYHDNICRTFSTGSRHCNLKSNHTVGCGSIRYNPSNNNNSKEQKCSSHGDTTCSNKCPGGNGSNCNYIEDEVFENSGADQIHQQYHSQYSHHLHQGCRCDPVGNFHHLMGKHLPKAILSRHKHGDKKILSDSQRNQDSHPEMTLPEGNAGKLNTDDKNTSCVRIRRSYSLPSLMGDEFTNSCLVATSCTGTISKDALRRAR